MIHTFRRAVFCIAFLGLCAGAAEAPRTKVLFLGDGASHRPAERYRQFAPAMMNRGIEVVYSEDLAVVTTENLRRYDALLIYANIDAIAPEPERALLDYVQQGGGLVALHSASHCFRNSPRYAALVGAKFLRHGTGTFRTRNVAPDHPVMRGFAGFESWDETYVHAQHNDAGRTVLERRDDEPYTWVRAEGKGRVFYTAWGHDQRTWTNAGFIELVERGIHYAAGQRPSGASHASETVRAPERTPVAGVPYYPPGQRTLGDGAWPEMQKPLGATGSMRRLVVPAGFEVQLFAAEPDIRKPITMAWDERGRLWIAESVDYPNKVRQAGEPGQDRIVVCEDTDGDGRADRFTVFAEGLNIPTGLAFARGGVIVFQAPETLLLKDTDGDGRADVREVLFTGWGRRDTHSGPNSPVYGFDNWIWGTVGYSGFSGSVGGKPLSLRQGFFRFRPDGSQLEFLRATNNNTWGIGFAEDGTVFGSTANNNPSVYLPVPDRLYAMAGLEPRTLGGIADSARFLPMTDRVRQVDVHWGFTAAAGHALYTARAYPRRYWNRVAFVTEPTGHLVAEFNLEPSGANFRATNPANLVASDDEWFAPIMAEVGPDGAVWVLDWHNYIVQHNPTPRGFETGSGNAYESPLRDRQFGRVYRIVWARGEGARPQAPFTLEGASPERLVAALGHDNLLWRRHAQRLLVERDRRDVVPALTALVLDPRVDELGLNVAAIHALWTLHGLRAIDAQPNVLAVVTGALRHPSAAVRRHAATVLPPTAATGAAILAANLLGDPHPQVRLAALLALAEIPTDPGVGAALHALLAPAGLALDRWTVDAATIAASRHAPGFLAAAKPAQVDAARRPTEPANAVLPVDSFERDPTAPLGWELAIAAGTAEIGLADIGRGGKRSLRLAATGTGADASATRRVRVKRHTRYELAGFIRSESVAVSPGALGAFLHVASFPPSRRVATPALKDTMAWWPGRVAFDTGTLDEIVIACVIGGGGLAQGTAYFDEIVLTDLGPADETVAEPLSAVLGHVLRRSGNPAPAEETKAGVRDALRIELGVVPDVMRYDQLELSVRAGQAVRLVFTNRDHMPHNFLLLEPGNVETIGRLADEMLADPQAQRRDYIPVHAAVLASTPLVNPGESFVLEFTAPSQPGRYPYVCTFPGHWRIMQGVLVVTAGP